MLRKAAAPGKDVIGIGTQRMPQGDGRVGRRFDLFSSHALDSRVADKPGDYLARGFERPDQAPRERRHERMLEVSFTPGIERDAPVGNVEALDAGRLTGKRALDLLGNRTRR